jgi:hypothetical protein
MREDLHTRSDIEVGTVAGKEVLDHPHRDKAIVAEPGVLYNDPQEQRDRGNSQNWS